MLLKMVLFSVQTYFVSKILAEKAMLEVAKETDIDFIIIIPPVVVGPFITSTFPPSLITALSPITGTIYFHVFNIMTHNSCCNQPNFSCAI